MPKLLAATIFILFSRAGFSQEVKGIITNDSGNPIAGVNIVLDGTQIGTTTGLDGAFSLKLDSLPAKLKFSHVQYESKFLLIDRSNYNLLISLKLGSSLLDQVEVISEEARRDRREAGLVTVGIKSARFNPAPFPDFTRILATLPGVVSNNELSSSYSVRGGNFDENLVYVNGIEVYRPFLTRSGQQEGLSFVNTDLVSEVRFSAGGWQPELGDKLSSSLDIRYRTPEEFAGSATLGLLGGSLNIEGSDGSNKFLIGVRHKNSSYLLNTLSVKGEYRPKFTDAQAYIERVISENDNSTTTLGALVSIANNNYRVVPTARVTEFGSLAKSLRFIVAFDGAEQIEYTTYQGGLKLEKQSDSGISATLVVSGSRSNEYEFTDLEGGYRLCDIDNNPGSNSFNECVVTRGIGTNYRYARNRLNATVLNANLKGSLQIANHHQIAAGIAYSFHKVNDFLQEYSFIDSSDYVSVNYYVDQENNFSNHKVSGYVQATSDFNSLSFTYGTRVGYNTYNSDLLISPRAQLAYSPIWDHDIVFRMAGGVYYQTPFYRELREFDGSLRNNLNSQKAIHLIAGVDYDFKMWDRDFKWLTEAYFKLLRDVIPYTLDNVRIRYSPELTANGRVMGLDLRLSGEFIPGTESWLSLGILSAVEDIDLDARGWIPAPGDQRLNLGIAFEDHIPNNPKTRVNVTFYYGTGLPFGPPNVLHQRALYRGKDYKRADMGFSRIFSFNENSLVKSMRLAVEVLNLAGIENTISYSWVEDVNGLRFAIPNTLSNRFFNLKLTTDF